MSIYTVLNMTKNVTVSVPDDLAKQMESLKEVNWSQVARTAFNQYIIQRKSPDIAGLLKELNTQKGEEFVRGRAFAESVVKGLGYEKFDLFMKEFEVRRVREFERNMMGPLGPTDILLSNEEIVLELLIKQGRLSDASTAFLKGLTERMKEIYKALYQ